MALSWRTSECLLEQAKEERFSRMEAVSRRNVLKSLSIGVMAGSVLSVIPLEAAEYAHKMIATRRRPSRLHIRQSFSCEAIQDTLQALCKAILPADAECGGALEAGAPEFIDLLTSENAEYQLKFGGGLMWLDAACADHYGNASLDCEPQQQKEMLDRIAYRKNAVTDESLSQGVEFLHSCAT